MPSMLGGQHHYGRCAYLYIELPSLIYADISSATCMTLDDIYTVLKYESMINIRDSPLPSYSTPSTRGRFRSRGRGRPSVPRRKAESVPVGEEDKIEIPTQYEIVFDPQYVEAILQQYEGKGHLTLRPDRLKYHPFLVTRDPMKPAGAIAKATLMTNTNRAADSTPSEVLVTANGEMGPATEKHMNGEDDAALAMPDALSIGKSAVGKRKKRGSDESNSEPVKKLRSADWQDGSTNQRTMRILAESGITEKDSIPIREVRVSVNGYGANGLEEEEDEQQLIEDAGEGSGEGLGAYGDEDAEGEDDEEYAP